MYTGREIPPLPPSLQSAGFADGFVQLCPQSALTFGSDRRTPVATRPVVRIKFDGARAVVLACTTAEHRGSPEFYELTPERVMWTQEQDRPSFAFWRYEVVPCVVIRDKVGVLHHAARIDLLSWLQSRY